MRRGFYEFPGRSRRRPYPTGAPRWFNPHKYGTVEAWYRSDAWEVDSLGFPFVGRILDLSGKGKHLTYYIQDGQPVALGVWDRDTYKGIPSFALFNSAYVNGNVLIPANTHRSVAAVFMPARSVYRRRNQYIFTLGSAGYRASSGETDALALSYRVNTAGSIIDAYSFTFNPTIVVTQSLFDFTFDKPNVWQSQWNGSALRLMQNGGSVASTSGSYLGPAGPYLALGSYINLSYDYIHAMFIFEVIVWSSAVDMIEVNNILQRQYCTGRV